MDNQTITLQDGSQLDPKVVKLTKIIKGLETQGHPNPYSAVGDGGASLGAFQWNNGKEPLQPGQLPKNWQLDAKTYLGDSNAQMTPANQNKVAYSKIKQWKDEGRTPEEIDALWNGAHKDVATGLYVHNSIDRQQAFRKAVAMSAQSQPQVEQTTTEGYTPAYQASSSDTGLTAAGKALGNLPGSFVNTAANLGSAILHPIETAKGIGKTIIGGLESAGGTTGTEETQLWDNFKEQIKQRYGSLEALSKTATEDPFGFGLDVVSVLDPALRVGKGITGVDLTGMAEKAGTTIAKPITAPITGTINTGKKLANYALGTGFSLSPTSVENIIKDPQLFSKANIENMSRESVAGDALNSIDQRINSLKDTGTEYSKIRQTPGIVTIPKEGIGDILEKQFGIVSREAVDRAGMPYTQVKLGPESVNLDAGGISTLQNFMDRYVFSDKMTPNSFLNARSAATDMASAGGDLGRIGQALRSYLNAIAKGDSESFSNLTKYVPEGEKSIAGQIAKGFQGKAQMPDLLNLDTKYGSEAEFLKGFKRDYMTSSGEFKPGAVNKIANLTGKGKAEQLAQLEKISPGITKKIQILKTIEDIEKASGLTPGHYFKNIIVGGGIATGNFVPAVIAAIMTSPEIGVKILRGIGYSKALTEQVLTGLRLMIGQTGLTPEEISLVLTQLEKQTTDSVKKSKKKEDKVTPESI